MLVCARKLGTHPERHVAACEHVDDEPGILESAHHAVQQVGLGSHGLALLLDVVAHPEVRVADEHVDVLRENVCEWVVCAG